RKGWERQASAVGTEEPRPKAEGLLEEVLRRENLMEGLKRVRSNRGAPGVDGMTVEALTPYLKEHWARIREELLGETYVPQPIRRVEIPKPDGKGVRLLGIPTVLDRLIQQSILQVLTPVFDPHFSESGYGFRPGRGCHDAVVAARTHVEAGYRFVVDMDLEKFFGGNHPVPSGVGGVLPAIPSEERLRGTGSVDTAEVALHPVAAVEEAANQSREDDPTRD
ncbi:MAG TPA: reverse transcriptase domain-containing protein, partial [Candidatus Deferrimicrobium sp.]